LQLQPGLQWTLEVQAAKQPVPEASQAYLPQLAVVDVQAVAPQTP
jgi:hypothetical protein